MLFRSIIGVELLEVHLAMSGNIAYEIDAFQIAHHTEMTSKQAIVLYEYQPTRKAEHAEAFLKGFSGWLHADGYQG